MSRLRLTGIGSNFNMDEEDVGLVDGISNNSQSCNKRLDDLLEEE